MNENPQAILFCNNLIRRMADEYGSEYMGSKKLVLAWAAQGLANVIANDDAIIDDGAAVDGRPQITGQQVYALLSIAQSLVNFYETGQLSGGSTSGALIPTVVSISVNAQSPI